MPDNGSGPGFVYVISFEDRYFKVGFAEYPTSRMHEIQASCPIRLRLVLTVLVRHMRGAERAVHEVIRDRRVRCEWFALKRGDLALIERTAKRCNRRPQVSK